MLFDISTSHPLSTVWSLDTWAVQQQMNLKRPVGRARGFQKSPKCSRASWISRWTKQVVRASTSTRFWGGLSVPEESCAVRWPCPWCKYWSYVLWRWSPQNSPSLMVCSLNCSSIKHPWARWGCSLRYFLTYHFFTLCWIWSAHLVLLNGLLMPKLVSDSVRWKMHVMKIIHDRIEYR